MFVTTRFVAEVLLAAGLLAPFANIRPTKAVPADIEINDVVRCMVEAYNRSTLAFTVTVDAEERRWFGTRYRHLEIETVHGSDESVQLIVRENNTPTYLASVQPTGDGWFVATEDNFRSDGHLTSMVALDELLNGPWDLHLLTDPCFLYGGLTSSYLGQDNTITFLTEWLPRGKVVAVDGELVTIQFDRPNLRRLDRVTIDTKTGLIHKKILQEPRVTVITRYRYHP